MKKEITIGELANLVGCEEEFGKTRLSKDLYSRWHVKLDKTLWVVREDLFHISGFSSKTEMDFYFLTYAAQHYAPPLPNLFLKNAIYRVRSFSELVSRRHIMDNLSKLEVHDAKHCVVTVSTRAAGILSKYPTSKSFLVNLVYSGLFSDIADLPDVYRAECLELYNKLLGMHNKVLEEPLNIRKEAINLLKASGKMKLLHYVSAMRERGISEQDAYNILDELASQGFIKLEGLMVEWIK